MVATQALRLGVDLGGTKTEAVVVELTATEPRVLAKRRLPTERDRGYDHVVEATARLIAEVARDSGLASLPPIGVGMPGSVTANGVVKNSNTTCLNGRPFRRDLIARVRAPIAFENDANCFALAEARYGAARGARVTFGVILGTGVGGGIVIRDSQGAYHTWEGAQHIAGEWGHVVLDPKGPACYCGRRGCVEQYLSGPAIERDAGGGRSLVDIASDPAARPLLETTMDVFGRALGTVINIVDPDVVVLGGGVSNLSMLYSEGIAAVARWTFTDVLTTRIVKNALGDSAGVFGAALLPGEAGI